ncbi:MAG: ParB/RepB/Spo0J family partition protein [Myxococcales bacterium]|nr:ParB/RepB/Spo0J family partition protein [Myxococcales bacterium]
MANESSSKRKSLGRGLSALIPSAASAQPTNTFLTSSSEAERQHVLSIPIEELVRDESQPRQNFDTSKLEELAASIREQGIVQPILARREKGTYKIIAGERRWRAAQLAGLKEVPVLIRELSSQDAFVIALIENLQRTDLNPIEEAMGYRRLMEEHGLTQEAVAERVGKNRSSIANALRLLNLPESVKAALISENLNMGHARALLGLADENEISQTALQVIQEHLSVRSTEQLVRKLKNKSQKAADKAAPTKKEDSPQIRSLTEELQRALGTKVRIQEGPSTGQGLIEIQFFSYDDLERILDQLMPDRD